MYIATVGRRQWTNRLWLISDPDVWQTGRLKTWCRLPLQKKPHKTNTQKNKTKHRAICHCFHSSKFSASFFSWPFSHHLQLAQSKSQQCSSYNQPTSPGFGLISAVAKIIVACWVCWVTDRALTASDMLCRLRFFLINQKRLCLAAIIQHSSQVPLFPSPSHWIPCLLSTCWKKKSIINTEKFRCYTSCSLWEPEILSE